MKEVGQVLRARRLEKELRLKNVAGMAGISVSYLCDLEHGVRLPSIEVLQKLCAALCLRAEIHPAGVEITKDEVARPRPDWSIAPAWVNWWAVDPDGYCHWFDNEPILDQVTSAPDIIGPRWSHVGRKSVRYEAVNIPIGVDWRTLIERRPEAYNAS